jgi:hypothetical protein
MAALDNDYYQYVRMHPRTTKLVAHYVSMGVRIKDLPQQKLDVIIAEYIGEAESAFTDLFWQHDHFKSAVQDYVKKQTNKNGDHLLRMLLVTNRQAQYKQIEELFEETEKHFKQDVMEERRAALQKPRFTLVKPELRAV